MELYRIRLHGTVLISHSDYEMRTPLCSSKEDMAVCSITPQYVTSVLGC